MTIRAFATTISHETRLLETAYESVDCGISTMLSIGAYVKDRIKSACRLLRIYIDAALSICMGKAAEPIFLILGLSGAGKSTFCQFMSAECNFLHIEGDGLSEPGDATEADVGIDAKNPLQDNYLDRIRKTVRARNKKGAIIGFTSDTYLSPLTCRALRASNCKVVYFVGKPELCAQRFLNRETGLNRGLDGLHWIQYNYPLIVFLGRKRGALRKYCVDVFDEVGHWRGHIAILNQINGM